MSKVKVMKAFVTIKMLIGVVLLVALIGMVPVIIGSIADSKIAEEIKVLDNNGFVIQDTDSSTYLVGKREGTITIEEPKKAINFLISKLKARDLKKELENVFKEITQRELKNNFQGITLKYSVLYSKIVGSVDGKVALFSLSNETMEGLKKSDSDILKLLKNEKFSATFNEERYFKVKDFEYTKEKGKLKYQNVEGIYGEKTKIGLISLSFDTVEISGEQLVFSGTYESEKNNNLKFTSKSVSFTENKQFPKTVLSVDGISIESISVSKNGSLDGSSKISVEKIRFSDREGGFSTDSFNGSFDLKNLDSLAYDKLIQQEEVTNYNIEELIKRGPVLKTKIDTKNLNLKSRKLTLNSDIIKFDGEFKVKENAQINQLKSRENFFEKAKVKVVVSKGLAEQYKPFIIRFLQKGETIYNNGMNKNKFTLTAELKGKAIFINDIKQGL